MNFLARSFAPVTSLASHDRKHRARHTLLGRWPIEISDEDAQNSQLARLLGGCFAGDPDSEDKIGLIAEIAGAAALGHATRLTEPKAVVLKGETAENGKSQVLDLLRGLLPKDAAISIPLGKFSDEKYLVHLSGKLLNASDELTSASAVASDAFKQIVTGEPIIARDVYRSATQFRCVAQHVFATNDLPTFKGGMDRGVRRRLMVITFNRVIPKADRIPYIGTRIAEEEPDLLLDWAANGAARLLRERKFTTPSSSDEALREWLFGADPVLAWLETAVEIDCDAPPVKSADVYKAFANWASDEGFSRGKLPAINNFVQRVIASGKGITNKRDARSRYLVGLRFVENSDPGASWPFGNRRT